MSVVTQFRYPAAFKLPTTNIPLSEHKFRIN